MSRLNPLMVATSQTREAKRLLTGIDALRSGGVIALPTDTIYGIAALAQCSSAIQKIYDIKQRIESKPLAICVGSIQHVYRWCEVTISKSLLESLLPGPVTLVMKRSEALNPSLNPGVPLVGVRIPDYPLIRDLCDQLNEPLALTSANISNCRSALKPEEFKELWPLLDVVYDGGLIANSEMQRLGSTVVNLSKDGYFSFIRPGCAKKETQALLLQHGLVEEVNT